MNSQERTVQELQAVRQAEYVTNKKRALFGPYREHYRQLVKQEEQTRPADHVGEKKQQQYDAVVQSLTAAELHEAWDQDAHPEYFADHDLAAALGREMNRRFAEQKAFRSLSPKEQQDQLLTLQETLDNSDPDGSPFAELQDQKNRAKLESLRSVWEDELQQDLDRDDARKQVEDTETRRQLSADQEDRESSESPESPEDPEQKQWQDRQKDLASRVFAAAGLHGVEAGTAYLERAARIAELDPEERDRQEAEHRTKLDQIDSQKQPERFQRLQEETLLYDFANALDRRTPDLPQKKPEQNRSVRSVEELPEEDQVEVVDIGGHALALRENFDQWKRKHIGKEARLDRRERFYNRMYRELDQHLNNKARREQESIRRGHAYLDMLQPAPEACITLPDLTPEPTKKQIKRAERREFRKADRKLKTGIVTADEFTTLVHELPIQELETYGDTMDKLERGKRLSREDPGRQFLLDPQKRQAVKNELQDRNAEIDQLASIHSPEELNRRSRDLQDRIDQLGKLEYPGMNPQWVRLNRQKEMTDRAKTQAEIHSMTPEEVVAAYANGFAQVSLLSRKGDPESQKQAEALSKQLVPYRAELLRSGKQPEQEAERYFARQRQRTRTRPAAPDSGRQQPPVQR